MFPKFSPSSVFDSHGVNTSYLQAKIIYSNPDYSIGNLLLGQKFPSTFFRKSSPKFCQVNFIFERSRTHKICIQTPAQATYRQLWRYRGGTQFIWLSIGSAKHTERLCSNAFQHWPNIVFTTLFARNDRPAPFSRHLLFASLFWEPVFFPAPTIPRSHFTLLSLFTFACFVAVVQSTILLLYTVYLGCQISENYFRKKFFRKSTQKLEQLWNIL